MLYRLKFDNWVGGILKHVLGSTSGALSWWPAGSTAHWVRWGKEHGLSPLDAACVAVVRTAYGKVDQRLVSPDEASRFRLAALDLAEDKGSAAAIREILAIAVPSGTFDGGARG